MSRFKLLFSGGPKIELLATEFFIPLLESPIIATRGKTSGAYQVQATFQWTYAVQALSCLVVNAKMRSLGACCIQNEANLEGYGGSLAASLDAAISKRPLWLLDMFGLDSYGEPVAKRIFYRSNSGL